MSNPVLVASARHARACHYGDAAAISAAKQDFLEAVSKSKQDVLEARLRRAVAGVLSASPPLDSERRAAVAMFLLGGGG